MMAGTTPFILFIMGATLSFCVWLVKKINDIEKQNEKQNAIQDLIISNMANEIKNLHQKLKDQKDEDSHKMREQKEDHNKQMEWVINTLQNISEALGAAKSGVEQLVMKGLKTHKA